MYSNGRCINNTLKCFLESLSDYDNKYSLGYSGKCSKKETFLDKQPPLPMTIGGTLRLNNIMEDPQPSNT